jgi:NAD(P)-dependent dehydrogenase (short-subunit alcohol dehydrogenase family)
MMARSEDKTNRAMASIKTATPKSDGEMVFVPLDLSDLSSVKKSADEFLRREQRLDILFNNAGVGYPGKGSKSRQGYELQLGVNCIGTFAFTKLLTPTLVSTAKTSPANTVRVVWVSSSASEAVSSNGFVEGLSQIEEKGSFHQYCVSKLGGYLYGTEFAARYRADGVLSVPLNPGNLDSDFWRTRGPVLTWLLRRTVLNPSIYGAYTCLFAAFSPEVTLEKSGSYGEFGRSLVTTYMTNYKVVVPWGRLWYVSDEMKNASKDKAEGGTGIARQFWEWTETEVQRHI